MTDNGHQSNYQVAGEIEYTFSTGLLPWPEPEDFVAEVRGVIRGAVYCEGQAIDEDVILGQVELWHVMLTQAINEQRRLRDIFESHSDVLADVHTAIFESEGYDTRPELRLEAAWDNLLYIRSIEVDPRYRETSLVPDALESAIETICPSGIVVTDAEELDLTSREIFLLALSKVPDTSFLFRDTCTINPHRRNRDDE